MVGVGGSEGPLTYPGPHPTVDAQEIGNTMTDKQKSKQVPTQIPSKFGAKADFIRSQPESMSAREVAEAAAARGLKISVNHVYNLRNAPAKLSAGTASGSDSGEPVRRRGPGRPRARVDITVAERQLRLAIAEVGLKRAREIFDVIAKAFRGE